MLLFRNCKRGSQHSSDWFQPDFKNAALNKIKFKILRQTRRWLFLTLSKTEKPFNSPAHATKYDSSTNLKRYIKIIWVDVATTTGIMPDRLASLRSREIINRYGSIYSDLCSERKQLKAIFATNETFYFINNLPNSRTIHNFKKIE